MAIQATNSPATPSESSALDSSGLNVPGDISEADSSFVVEWAIETPEGAGAETERLYEPTSHSLGEKTFSLEFHLDDRRAVVLFTGALDRDSAPQVRECLDLLIEQGSSYLDLNIADVQSLDPEIVDIFLNASNRLGESGKLRILRPQSVVADVLLQAGAAEAIEVIGGKNFEKVGPAAAENSDRWQTCWTKVGTR